MKEGIGMNGYLNLNFALKIFSGHFYFLIRLVKQRFLREDIDLA
jgi:hypothetical protein